MSFITSMTVLDWVFLAILIASVAGGISKGFVREIIALASVVVGLALACWFFPSAGHLYADFVKTPDIANLLGFITLFVGCILLGTIISLVGSKFVQAASLQWYDRFLGAAFGLLRGWLIGAILFMILTAYPVRLESLRNAKFAPYLLVGARVISVVVPTEIKNKFLDGYRKIQEFWKSQ
jgi:membrane protein required for colicin V production